MNFPINASMDLCYALGELGDKQPHKMKGHKSVGSGSWSTTIVHIFCFNRHHHVSKRGEFVACINSSPLFRSLFSSLGLRFSVKFPLISNCALDCARSSSTVISFPTPGSVSKNFSRVTFLGRNALGASCIIRWNFWQVEQNGAWKKKTMNFTFWNPRCAR